MNNHTSKYKVTYWLDGKKCTKTIVARTFAEPHEMRLLASSLCNCDYHDVVSWERK